MDTHLFYELKCIVMERICEVAIIGEEDTMIIIIDGKKYKTKLIPDEKLCAKCKETKSLEDFNIDRYKLDGRSSYCKICALKNLHAQRDRQKANDVKNAVVKRGRGRPRKILEKTEHIITPIY